MRINPDAAGERSRKPLLGHTFGVVRVILQETSKIHGHSSQLTNVHKCLIPELLVRIDL
jgi:hypothetical protein